MGLAKQKNEILTRFLSCKEPEVRSSLNLCLNHVISLHSKYSNGGIDTSIGTSQLLSVTKHRYDE